MVVVCKTSLGVEGEFLVYLHRTITNGDLCLDNVVKLPCDAFTMSPSLSSDTRRPNSLILRKAPNFVNQISKLLDLSIGSCVL